MRWLDILQRYFSKISTFRFNISNATNLANTFTNHTGQLSQFKWRCPVRWSHHKYGKTLVRVHLLLHLGYPNRLSHVLIFLLSEYLSQTSREREAIWICKTICICHWHLYELSDKVCWPHNKLMCCMYVVNDTSRWHPEVLCECHLVT